MITVAAARTLAAQGLKVALAYAGAGVHEEGGNNRGDQVEFFQRLLGGRAGDPWCADFVCSCLVKAFAELAGLAEDRAALAGYVEKVTIAYLPMTGYCPSLWAGAELRGMNRDKHFSPLPGDLVLFDFVQAGQPHHVGIVVSADAGTVHTVEGNTSSGLGGSQADGDGVFRRVRSRQPVFGFIHF